MHKIIFNITCNFFFLHCGIDTGSYFSLQKHDFLNTDKYNIRQNVLINHFIDAEKMSSSKE